MPHVLLLLPDTVGRRTLRRHLTGEAGATLCDATDAASASQLLRSEPVDAAIVDSGLLDAAPPALVDRLRSLPRLAVLVACGEGGVRWLSDTEARRLALLVAQPAADGDRHRLSAGDLELDRQSMTAWRGGRRLELTHRTYQLLETLMRAPDTVFSVERLSATIWGLAASPDVVYAYVGYLRQELEAGGEARVLRTVRGFGYVLDSTPRPARAPVAPLNMRRQGSVPSRHSPVILPLVASGP